MAFSKACDRIRCSTPLLIPSDSFRNVDNALTNGSDTTYSESDILDAISEEDAEKLTSAISKNNNCFLFGSDTGARPSKMALIEAKKL